MALSTQPYKGTRDFYPEDKRIQKYLFSKMREVVESFGYEEYDAPLIEPLELYLAKSGSEIVKEQSYQFEDRGGRQVVIRPEMTPSVSRLVAGRRQELAYPLRWYSIPNLWRYERAQRGRLREHWQLNVDIFGVANLAAEHEVVMILVDIFKAYGAKSSMYKLKLNSRQLISDLFKSYLGLGEQQVSDLMRLIDKKARMTESEFKAGVKQILSSEQQRAGLVEKTAKLLEVKKIDELPKEVAASKPAQDLKQLFDLLDVSKVDNYEFDICLMRGLDYYTGIVFEVFDTHEDNNRALFGGGRYDDLVGLFGAESIPTVGFGMGDVALKDFLETHNLLPKLGLEADLDVVIVGDVYEAALVPITKLRESGLNVAVDSSGAKLDKQLKSSAKRGSKYVLIIGANELSSGSFKLRHLPTSQESDETIEEIVRKVKHP